jgi:hypothetical protein
MQKSQQAKTGAPRRRRSPVTHIVRRLIKSFNQSSRGDSVGCAAVRLAFLFEVAADRDRSDDAQPDRGNGQDLVVVVGGE